MNLLSPSQYGFQKAHPTQHAILDIVNAMLTNMDKRLLSCSVFIDLKKALILLIIIPYCINLNTLTGFRGAIKGWLSSYLQGRTKTTQIGPNVSSRTDVTCGVPQGSILGPVHTYPEICENANFFLRIRLASTRIQRIFRPYPEIFENALQSGNFFIRY